MCILTMQENVAMLYEKLNYIIAIAEEQNLTQAAKKLYISQPTLTQYLNRLEAELGVKLFNRSKTPVTLTEAGSYYLERMRQIYMSEQTLRNELLFLSNPSHTLTIGIGQVRGHHWLPRILPPFISIRPDVNIQIVQGPEQSMFEDLKRQRLDIVIGSLPSSNEVTAVPLLSERLIFAAHQRFGLIPDRLREQYSFDNPYIAEPHQLDGLPFIIPQVNNGLYTVYSEILRSNSIRPSRTLSFNNLNTGLLLNMQGFGVQLIVSSMFHFAMDPGVERLDFFRLEDMPQSRTCVAAFHENSIKKNMILDFIRVLQDHINYD